VIAPDVMTKSVVADVAGLGNNRRLSSLLAFPAITVPAGFTTDGLPVGIEFMARTFDEAMLLKFAYAYEQGTRHRKPPASTPALRGEP
jgi:Asp-tRNA(Asn)/Glu-tRNA(Gln) amidotransferase A subunit family amidase